MPKPAWMKGKVWPKKDTNWLPYKNKFEHDIGKILKEADYESKARVVEYHIDAKYNVDFTFKHIPWLLIEAKGRFHDGSNEARKYLWVKKCNPKLEFVFIFSNLNSIAYSGLKRRKDGSYLTMGEWAAKNGFVAFTHKFMPDWLTEGKATRELFSLCLNHQRQTYGLKELTAGGLPWE